MESIFSKIAKGEIPSYRVAADDRFYAFLDINPVAPGHTLVIPRRQEDYIFDLSDDELAAMSVFAKRVARALKAAMPCRKVGVAVIGLEVPHAHIHLVPMQREADMDFHHKTTLPDEEMRRIADAVAEAYNQQNPQQ